MVGENEFVWRLSKKKNELYHYGVKGMKWGVRRARVDESTLSKKKHLGIDERGNINLVNQKSNSGYRKFAIKMVLTLSTVGISTYIAKHPDTIMKGYSAVSEMMKKSSSIIDKDVSTDSNIFSKKLGRMLTIDEATELGLY